MYAPIYLDTKQEPLNNLHSTSIRQGFFPVYQTLQIILSMRRELYTCKSFVEIIGMPAYLTRRVPKSPKYCKGLGFLMQGSGPYRILANGFSHVLFKEGHVVS